MISPVAFTLFGFPIYWYGLAYIAAFTLGQRILLFLCRYEHNPTLSSRLFSDRCVSWFILGGILGGRLGYVLFYDLSYHLAHPLEIVKVWKGGMSFHGGIVGFLLTGLALSRYYRVSFLRLSDLVALATTPGIAIVRMANFVNQEHYGRPTSSVLGMVFPRANDEVLRYPSQIFEAFGEGLCLGIILFFLWKKTQKSGILFSSFFMGYGLIRFVLEFFREPEGFVGPLTTGQALCLPLIGAGLIMILYLKFHKSSTFLKR